MLCNAIARDGFVVIPEVLSREQVSKLLTLFRKPPTVPLAWRRGGVYATRNLLGDVPDIAALALSAAILRLVELVLGPRALLVRTTLFDKAPEPAGQAPWHQDLSIVVKRMADVPGFGPWSTQAGALHVDAPPPILEGMLTVQIHLDGCSEADAPLRVIPGSHLLGRLSAGQMRTIGASGSLSCRVPAGGALVVRPLLGACRGYRFFHSIFSSPLD